MRPAATLGENCNVLIKKTRESKRLVLFRACMSPLLEGLGSPEAEVRYLSVVSTLGGIQSGFSLGILSLCAYNLPVLGRIHMCLT